METSRLYTWAATTRVINLQRGTPCTQTSAFLHSEGTVTFDLAPAPQGPFCLLHAQHPDAYPYVPRDRVDGLLKQASEARDRWTTQLVIHRGQPPADQWKQYQGGLRHIAGEVAHVLSDLRQALPVLQTATPDSPEAGEYEALFNELTELLAFASDPQ